MDNNTAKSFYDKWHNNKNLAFQNTLKEGSDIQKWILTRNGWNSLLGLQSFLNNKKNILDAGCGNGRVTALLAMNASKGTFITGIDLTAADVAKENLTGMPNVFFHTKDLMDNNSDIGKFDFIYCQEVLHHTNNPFLSFSNLAKNNLADNGTIAIYVYKKKAPIREYTDDFIRNKIAGMSYEEAMEHCNQITEFSKNISKQKEEFYCPEIELLGISAGNYTPQRFIYHFFMKCFWNGELDFNQNSAINYDWYHPQNCTRHSIDEIKGWFKTNNLEVTRSYEDFYGITMHGVKK
ncbi:MAG: class I SAM-dependent methyltransferase [Bacteroidetes bacterium]|nr:class I SAM-dependent methyltransferase [Bacteroidota bacterium]